ncbi:MAG: hypothetical protein ACI9F9_001373 [Candidatus Paceibacteria bacterium]|jgi:hypothetical protein
MKVEIGFLALAFLGGMATQDQLDGERIEWIDYGEDIMGNPEFMKDWIASATPGAEHKKLAAHAGKWNVGGKMWMEPEGEPMASVGTSEIRMVLGGRFQIEEFNSEFMGQPFEGMLIQGYSNLHEQSFHIWIDNMSTWPSIAWGARGEDGVIATEGKMYDVMTPAGRPTRTRQIDNKDGSRTMEMFDTIQDGTQFKVMEYIYSRE